MGAKERDMGIEDIDLGQGPLRSFQQMIEFNNLPFKRSFVAKYTVTSKHVTVRYGANLRFTHSETTNPFACNEMTGEIDFSSFTVLFYLELPPMSSTIIEITQYKE